MKKVKSRVEWCVSGKDVDEQGKQYLMLSNGESSAWSGQTQYLMLTNGESSALLGSESH